VRTWRLIPPVEVVPEAHKFDFPPSGRSSDPRPNPGSFPQRAF